MLLVSRAQNMIVRPAFEWPIVALEPATPAGLYSSYIVPLALITPICTFLSYALFLHHLVLGLVAAILSFVLELVYVFVAALIAQSLASNFGGINDRMAALKWIAYAYTPRWVAGIAALIPLVGGLIILIASLYSLYVLYLGATPMMRVPQDKSVGYVAVVIVVLIILGIVVGAVVAAVAAAMMISGGLAAGAYGR